MSLIKKGGFDDVGGQYAIQTNRSITEKNDGTLEGTIVYRADRSMIDALPQIGDDHFDDSRLEMYQMSTTYEGLELVQRTGSFFGLVSKRTESVISYSGGQNNEPIDTHPDFEAFAGTADDPLNGAQFDEETEIFLGFKIPNTDSPYNFRGTEYYLTPSTLISLSYWQDSVPKLKTRMSVVNSIPGFISPPDVVDFLLLDTPYRQVGSFYQVTEQYIGSGRNGTNRIIYPG